MLGHLSFNQLVKISKRGAVCDIPDNIPPKYDIYKSCQFDEKSRVKFKAEEYSSKGPLELIHTYILCPMRKIFPRGEQYLMLLVIS